MVIVFANAQNIDELFAKATKKKEVRSSISLLRSREPLHIFSAIQKLADVISLFFEVREKNIHLQRLNAEKMH